MKSKHLVFFFAAMLCWIPANAESNNLRINKRLSTLDGVPAGN